MGMVLDQVTAKVPANLKTSFLWLWKNGRPDKEEALFTFILGAPVPFQNFLFPLSPYLTKQSW